MKLLFDQNLSFKLCSKLDDLFPGSAQVRQLGLDQSDDEVIWDCARSNDFLLVSQDADFAELVAIKGSPPKLLWLRCGNQPTVVIENLLRQNAAQIAAFEKDSEADCMELW